MPPAVSGRRHLLILLRFPLLSIRFRDGAVHAAGISEGDNMIRYVVYDYTSGTNYNVAADPYAGDHDRSAAHPDVITDGDRASIFIQLPSQFPVDRMMCRKQLTAWPQEHIIADDDLPGVDKIAVIVGIEIIREEKTTFVLVTHDPEMRRYMDRTICLRDGRLSDTI